MPAGRPKGSPNKTRREAVATLLERRFPEYNPILSMAEIANDETVDINIRCNMHKEVSQYIAPKLKSIEMSGQLDSNIVYKPLIKRLDGTVDTDEE